jgi:predicted  nucleic acid-binding Zn-ribbon protein
MATAKKPAAKKPVVIKTAPKTVVMRKVVAKVPKDEPMFKMPMEVKEWIDQANSRLQHLMAQNERLKAEIADLKRANRNMERRVMGSEA